MKNECEIVKDLLPSYIGELLNKKTENFVKEHLEHCIECTLFLQEMKKNIAINKTDQDEQFEIDYLKKYKNRMTFFKLALFSVIFIIFIFASVFIIKYAYNTNIMKTVSTNTQNLKEQNNYVITTKEYRIDYKNNREYIFNDISYYKDGQYKIHSHSESPSVNIQNKDMYYYGKINSNERIAVFEDTKTVYNETTNYNYVKKGQFFNSLGNNTSLFDTDFGFFNNIFMKSGYQVRSERYNGKDCYVFKTQTSYSYVELWIDKKSMLFVRKIQDIYNSSYIEKTYNIIIGTVTNDDMSIPEFQGYKIENINNVIDKETLNFYNNIY